MGEKILIHKTQRVRNLKFFFRFLRTILKIQQLEIGPSVKFVFGFTPYNVGSVLWRLFGTSVG